MQNIIDNKNSLDDFQITDIRDVNWAFKIVNKEINALRQQVSILAEKVDNLTNLINATVKLSKIAGALLGGILLILQIHSWYSDHFGNNVRTEAIQIK